MTHDIQADPARRSAPAGTLTAAVSGAAGVALPPATISAKALAERLERKAAKLRRRHSLSEVIRGYISANGELLDRDPGRLSPLRMWDGALGAKLMDEITSDEVAEVLAMYAEMPVQRYVGKDVDGTPLYRSHGPRAPATINKAKVALSAVFTWAKSSNLLLRGHHSPTRDIQGKGFRAAQLPDRALPVDQVEALLAHARTAPWKKLYLFVLMALTTGARKSELRHLRGRDLVLDGPEPHALVGVRRTEAERAGTKNGDVKVLNLSPAVVKEIQRWGVPQRDDWLFPSERNPGQPFNMHSSYRALVKRVGFIENGRLHDLRHTAGTIFANEGKSESQIAALLGHRTLAMVPRYTRVQPHAKARTFRESALSRMK